MYQGNAVIFLIESNVLEKDFFAIAMQRLTNHRVFSFFSIEEAELYMSLKPQLIVTDDQFVEGKLGCTEILNISKSNHTLAQLKDKSCRVQKVADWISNALKNEN